MQLSAEDDRIELEPDATARASIIWLHGLGADGYDFEGIVPMLALPPEAAVRFVFPHAPVQAVSLNGGLEMRAWFDVYGIGPEFPEDQAGIEASAARLQELVAREQTRGVAPERIVLAGFSQGGAVALHAGLRSREPLAGVLALSTWLPLAGRLADEAVAERRQMPILMLHGSDDPVVPLTLAQRSSEHLRAAGFDPQFRTFPMAHSISAEELPVIGQWLQARLEL